MEFRNCTPFINVLLVCVIYFLEIWGPTRRSELMVPADWGGGVVTRAPFTNTKLSETLHNLHLHLFRSLLNFAHSYSDSLGPYDNDSSVTISNHHQISWYGPYLDHECVNNISTTCIVLFVVKDTLLSGSFLLGNITNPHMFNLKLNWYLVVC
jgi:hypothetical protein